MFDPLMDKLFDQIADGEDVDVYAALIELIDEAREELSAGDGIVLRAVEDPGPDMPAEIPITDPLFGVILALGASTCKK